MPAKARLPSGTLVEVLCGQPEQKCGIRSVCVSGLVETFKTDSRASRNAMRSLTRFSIG